MTPIALTPATGDGVTTVFTAASAVVNELFLVDRLPQIPTTDYSMAVVGGVSVYTFVVAPPATAVLTLFGTIAASGSILGGASYPTVAGVISDAAIELGLVATPIADPFASTDANILQLVALLKRVGREISRARDWTTQQTEYTFNTVNGQTLYVLPGGFRKKIDQTGWNRTTRFPLGGPLSPQEWQYLKAMPSAATLTVLFRPRNGQMEIYPAPGATVNTIAFEYITSYWLAVSGLTTPSKDAPTLYSDVVLFDSNLVVCALKVAWKREKGLDTTAAQQDYDAAMDGAQDDDAEAPVLRLDGKGGLGTRLLDGDNVPWTGFGS